MSRREDLSRVRVANTNVSVALCLPEGGIETARALVLLAHSAGSDMNHPLLVAVATSLAEGGYAAARFNFPYREAGRKAPDPAPKLESTWLAVWDMLHARLEGRRIPLVVGGKSMGGRVGAQLVTDGVLDPDAVLLFSYPLHRPGMEGLVRAEPLAGVRAPILFVTGTRDRMCRVELLDKVRRGLRARTTLHVVEGGDHTLDTGTLDLAERARVHAELAEVARAWLGRSLRARQWRSTATIRAHSLVR